MSYILERIYEENRPLSPAECRRSIIRSHGMAGITSQNAEATTQSIDCWEPSLSQMDVQMRQLKKQGFIPDSKTCFSMGILRSIGWSIHDVMFSNDRGGGEAFSTIKK